MNKVLFHFVRGLWFLLSLLPFCVHYLLSDIIYLIIYKLAGYRIKVVRGNLEASFPEKSEAELRLIARRFYQCLCDYFVETVKIRSALSAVISQTLSHSLSLSIPIIYTICFFVK